MNSLELAALEPYESGELKPHTAGIIRDIESRNEEFEEEDRFERVEIRRGLEIRLVKKFDKTKINARRECWFLMDTRWLTAWSDYVENKEDAELPGKLSTADLRDENGRILPGLQAKIDYRGVPPTVYYIFKELYGKDETEPICRYTVDIYNMPVPDDHLIQITKEPMTKARIAVNKVRQKYVKWGEDSDDEDDDWWFCGLTKDHIESILYWVLTCGKRGRSGRGSIRYRDYKPLKRTVGDGDDLSEWSVRSNSTLASIESDRSALGSIGDADRDFGQNSLVKNWVMGLAGYYAT